MEDERKYKSNPYLIALLVIGTIIVLIWVVSYAIYRERSWDFELFGIQFYYYYFEILFIIIALLSGQATYLDAKKIEAGRTAPHQKTFRGMTWTPLSWGVLAIVLWIFVFPAYLYMRSDIFWQNISVEYKTLKTIERDAPIETPKKEAPPEPEPAEYSENVGICPHCDSPYPLRMLEKSKYCPRCGRILKED
jgi:hypothetical protein